MNNPLLVNLAIATKRKKKEHSSKIHPGLDRSPKENWVDKAGGLPDYIERIAKHIHYDSGLSIDHAIAAAVERVKVLAAKGNPEAIKALAEWNAKRKRGGSRKLSGVAGQVLNLALIRQSKPKGSAQAYGKAGAGFDEQKHPRSPQDGKFAGKISPQEFIAAKRRVEESIANLQPGQTFELPDKLGWVKWTEAGYFVQGPAGYTASVSTLSSAVQAAAIIIAGKLPEHR
jgi:hypothetical protein